MTTLRKPVRRLTVETLGSEHGCDRGKKLIVSLEPGDLIALRPQRSQRVQTIRILDVYRYAIVCKANAAKMEKLREKKRKKEERAKAAKAKRERRKLFSTE